MTRKSFVLLVVGTMILSLCSISSAVVPDKINYQGKMTTASGGCLNDTVQMTFSIYSDDQGTVQDWTETQTQVVVKEGIFNVLLGSVVAIPTSVFDGSTKYLGVQVESDPEMTPLKPMVSVAYAYRAGTADGGGGDCGWVDDGNVVRLETVTDSVGIGTTSPVAKLDVVGDLNINSVYKIGGYAVLSAEGLANIFVGDYAGENNTGEHNTFIGNLAGWYHAAGNFNTFVGSGAGYWHQGCCNTSLGAEAGRSSTDSDSSVFIGYAAGYYEDGSHKLYIANSNTSSPLIYGEFDNEILAINGDLGVGTTSPIAVLHASGSEATSHGKNSAIGISNTASGGGNWYLRTGATGTVTPEGGFSIGDDNGYRISIDNTGNVGIGTSSPEGKLDVRSTTGAFIVPRMTTAQRDALTAVNGMIIYNTSTNQFNFYENGAWVTK
jgi:hypothetical protein